MLHQKMADNSLHLAITVDGRNTVVIITADEPAERYYPH